MKRFALCLAVLCLVAPLAAGAQSISVTPSALTFNAIADSTSDTKTFNIGDPDTYDLEVMLVRITGPDASQFQIGFTVPTSVGGPGLSSSPGSGSPSGTDADGDGVSNAYEALIGTNPNNADSDGDGSSDFNDFYPLDPAYHEAPEIYVNYGTNGSLPIVFRPTYTGQKNATLVLTHNAPGGTTTISLVGYSEPKPVPGVNFFCWANPGDMGGRFYYTYYGINVSNPVWDFGDGATSTERYPVHFYTSAGNYTVKFTATDSNGGKQYNSEHRLIFPERSFAPVADVPPDVLPPPPPKPTRQTSGLTTSGVAVGSSAEMPVEEWRARWARRAAGKIVAGSAVQSVSWGTVKTIASDDNK